MDRERWLLDDGPLVLLLAGGWTAILQWSPDGRRSWLSLDDGREEGGVTVTLDLTTRDLARLAGWSACHHHHALPACRVYRTLSAVVEANPRDERRCLAPGDIVALGLAARELLRSARPSGAPGPGNSTR